MHCTAEEEKCSLMGSCIVKTLKRGPDSTKIKCKQCSPATDIDEHLLRNLVYFLWEERQNEKFLAIFHLFILYKSKNRILQL